MHPQLRKYLSGLGSLTENEISEIGALIPVQTFKKGEVLLREGEIASYCYFVLTGCIRQYHMVNGEEKHTAFYTEHEAVVDFTSYAQQVPSKQNWACTEACTLITGDLRGERNMYEKYPKLQAITRGMMEQDYGKTQEAFARFMASSPEERYKHLLQTRPQLPQRVPQHQIASYLGITPESLSRIRRRMAGKG